MQFARTGARVLSRALRVTGRGGTTFPGKIVARVAGDDIPALAARVATRRIVVSATNGKTTTTAMIADALRSTGARVAHNVSGANLRSGVTTLLVTQQARVDDAVLEVDEAALPQVVRDVQPQVIVLGNLFRDQLDRYGELDVIIQRWKGMLADASDLPEPPILVVNVDDPSLAALADGYGGATVRFGIDADGAQLDNVPHAADARRCPWCSTALEYAPARLGHLGTWSCPACKRTRPQPDVRLTQIAAAANGQELRIRLRDSHAELYINLALPGVYNAYNALESVAVLTAIGVQPDAIADSLSAFRAAFGRFETIRTPAGVELVMLLAKNPTGLNEVVRTLTDATNAPAPTMFALNDAIADGRDTSWIWDADVEPLFAWAPILVLSGERAAELALRVRYSDVEVAQLETIVSLSEALDALIAHATSLHARAYVVLTYTAMMSLRAELAHRGWVDDFWKERA